MYINAIAHYVPSEDVANEYFERNGLTDEWIFQRTGIRNRKKASQEENTNTMAYQAIDQALEILPYPINEVDLIIGATYSPFDTVGTLSHYIQQKYQIDDAVALTVSSACSSFVNAVEIVEGYFATNKATKALIIASEHNTAYSNDLDPISGHLWGDGASVLFLSKERIGEDDAKILEVYTRGHGNIGKGPKGVCLRPRNGGIVMPHGKDVFINAIHYMTKATFTVLERHNLSPQDIKYLIPHQANARIINNVLRNLDLPPEKGVMNIENLGNTGCASTPIALSQIYDQLESNDYSVITVFGGGYSSGAVLIRKC
ncbi:MAG: 3-oxoacyl-ACP synthase III family protein [Hyphomicrobiales bacterium]